ncbi:hypothetical protein Plhal304r1_c031g0101661 [Plasmopara halstedii]
MIIDTSPGGKPPPDPAPPGQEGTTDDATWAFSGKQAATTEKDRSNKTVISNVSGKNRESTYPRSPVGSGATEQASNHNGQTHGVTVEIPLNYVAAVTSGGSDHEAWIKKLTAAATRVFKFRDDKDLRPMIPLEKEALAA